MTIEPVLYIIMRSDMDSLNPGKAMAQAAHAANQFVYKYEHNKANNNSDEIQKLYNEWTEQTEDGFGTTIVLDAYDKTPDMMSELFGLLGDPTISGVVYDSVLDPTYPIIDGSVLHLLPVTTCWYIFGDKNNMHLKVITDTFNLHP